MKIIINMKQNQKCIIHKKDLYSSLSVINEKWSTCNFESDLLYQKIYFYKFNDWNAIVLLFLLFFLGNFLAQALASSSVALIIMQLII